MQTQSGTKNNWIKIRWDTEKVSQRQGGTKTRWSINKVGHRKYRDRLTQKVQIQAELEHGQGGMRPQAPGPADVTHSGKIFKKMRLKIFLKSNHPKTYKNLSIFNGLF